MKAQSYNNYACLCWWLKSRIIPNNTHLISSNNSMETIACDGEDNLPQEGSGHEGSNTDTPTQKTITLLMMGAHLFVGRGWSVSWDHLHFQAEVWYKTSQVAKYGQPDSKYTKCPAPESVVEGILSNEALKQDEVAYKSQEMWLEVAEPLTACLVLYQRSSLCCRPPCDWWEMQPSTTPL